MSIMPIEVYGSTILRQQCNPVEKITPEIIQLISDMKESMKKSNGIGLAAPQVGVNSRIIIVTYGLEEENTYTRAMINPEIMFHNDETDLCEEGCLSVPDTTGSVERWTEIKIQALDKQGDMIQETLRGLTARVFQHELDHLNGILFIDRLSPIKQDLVKRKLKKKLKKESRKNN